MDSPITISSDSASEASEGGSRKQKGSGEEEREEREEVGRRKVGVSAGKR